MDKNETIRIELNEDQQRQIKAASGKDIAELEFTVQELEQRIAPRLSSNSNETLLTAQAGLAPDQTPPSNEANDHPSGSVDLEIEELEQRIAPTTLSGTCSTGSHFPSGTVTI